MLSLARSYLPMNHPAGFGVSDSLLFTLAILFCLLVFASAWLETPLRHLANRTGWCLMLLASLPVLLRLALLPHHPVPTPNTADDFSYLLLGDTLAHFRLANATHPMHRFFEAMFVLQEPHYSSIFPLGQGIVLAAGQLIFRNPWAGVILSMGVFSALAYWMLRAWVTPFWALLGALLGVCEFGPLSSWMNSYWGGGVSAIAGCLTFGAMVRLREGGRRRDALLLGCGLGLEVLARPFEATLLALCVFTYFAPLLFKISTRVAKRLTIAFAAILPALALTLDHSHAVSGQWTTLPYAVSQFQYGVPTTFVFQSNPEPHRDLTREQDLDYHAQRAVHGDQPETLGRYLDRLGYRLRFYRFFFYAPLLLVVPAFLGSLKDPRYRWVVLWVAIFSLGTNFYPYFYPHYIAALTCVFLLISVVGLQRLSRLQIRGIAVGREMARAILFLCTTQFCFWYGLHLFYNPESIAALGRYETWDYINYGDPDGRSAVNQQLSVQPGKQLVFVRYSPRHLFEEWIHNAANIDEAKVVFAGDRGDGNTTLRKYYPDRKAWILEPDTRPPSLYPYPEPIEPPAPSPQPPPPSTRKKGDVYIDPKLFETVH
jgi:hypothetical protein